MQVAAFTLLLLARLALGAEPGFIKELKEVAVDPSQLSQLEEGFFSENRKEYKAKYAYLLGISGDLDLNVPVFEYAEFALKHYLPMTPEDRKKLLRIAGDSRFKNANLIQARSHYLQLLSLHPDLELRTYITLQLGWTWMNLDKAHEAYHLWTNFLMTEKTETTLFEQIALSAGKAWSEAVLSRQVLNIRELPPEHERAFIRGVIHTLEREKQTPKELISALKASKAQRWLTPIILAWSHYSSSGCEITYWIQESGDFMSLENPKIRDLVWNCAKTLVESKNLLRNRKLIQMVQKNLEKIPSIGLERWPLIQVYEKSENLTGACREWSAFGKHFIASNDHPKILSAIKGIIKNCFQNKNTTQQAHSLINESLNHEAFVQWLINSDRDRVFTSLFKNEETLNLLYKNMISKSSSWKDSSLKANLLLHSSISQDRKDQALVALFPTPLRTEEIPYLLDYLTKKIKKKNFSKVDEFMTLYFPLHSDLSLNAIKLWLTFVFSSESASETHGDRVINLALSNQRMGVSMEEEIWIWLKIHQKWENILTHWELFKEKIYRDQKFIDQIFQVTLDACKNRSNLCQRHQENPIIKTANSVSEVLLNRQEFNFDDFFPPLKKHVLFKQLKLVRQLDDLEKHYRTLSFENSKIEKTLTTEIYRLRNLFKKALSIKWYSKDYLKLADQKLMIAQEALSDFILKIPTQNEQEKIDLSKTSEAIMSWRLL